MQFNEVSTQTISPFVSFLSWILFPKNDQPSSSFFVNCFDLLFIVALLTKCCSTADAQDMPGRILRSVQHHNQSIRPQIARAKTHGGSLEELVKELDVIFPCNKTLDTFLVRRLLDFWQRQKAEGSTAMALFELGQLFSQSMVSRSGLKSIPSNTSLTTHPVIQPVEGQASIGLQLVCEQPRGPRWIPVAVFPTQIAGSYLQMQLHQLGGILELDACSLSPCMSKCHYSVHSGIRVYGRTCCSDLSFTSDPFGKYCRHEMLYLQTMFYILSSIFFVGCLLMVVFVLRERRKQRPDSRARALMEPALFGAALLNMIPLIDWLNLVQNSCWLAVMLRQIGFTLFYASIILKVYKALQMFRVRKAHHVTVREHDLVKYLALIFLIVIYGLIAWSSGIWSNTLFWASTWPQCPFEEFTIISAVFEQLCLMYGLCVCYKVRNSDWPEKFQFTTALLLEFIVTLVVNFIKFSLNGYGSNEVLLILSVVHLHLTISINTIIIMTPKFLAAMACSDSGRRTGFTGTTGIGYNSHHRAHPSLAKLRDNLINGTIDFGEVPIADMNPEDIRAELKRVYTQLRMYKLKNAYQDNPHLNKRKGGAKKHHTTFSNNTEKQLTGKNRRISLPPQSSGSPKISQIRRPPIIEIREDEKSDLTVESAPHNIYFSSQKILNKTNVEQSIRV